MTSQHRKHRGYQSQRFVAAYLRRWWPFADATGAGRQGSDVLNTPGITWEVKARRELDITKAMRQAEGHGGAVQLLVIRPDGWGEAKIADWPTLLPLSKAVELLLAAGYGTDPDTEEKTA